MYVLWTSVLVVLILIVLIINKACEVNPDAVLFIHVKDLRTHFQALFDR